MIVFWELKVGDYGESRMAEYLFHSNDQATCF
jgi:hypothetical protein